MVEQLIDTLKSMFEAAQFSVHVKNYGNVTYKIDNFFVRFEKYTKDVILYVHPRINEIPDSYSLDTKTKRIIEKQLENKLFKYGVSQVIVPYDNFFHNLQESLYRNSSKKEQEMSGFIYSKLKNKRFRTKLFKAEAAYKIHPYIVENGTLFFEVRDLELVSTEGIQKEANLKHFRKLIQQEVFDTVSHLGVRKANMIIKTKREDSGVLSEAVDEKKLKFVKDKKFTNYLTPEGMISFIVTDPVVKDGVLGFSIKKFHCTKGGKISYEVDSNIKPYISMVVGDEAAKYGFTKVDFLGLENTTIG